MSDLTIETAPSLLGKFYSQFPQLDLEPIYKEGRPAPRDTRCVSCAKPIAAGEIMHTTDFLGDSFGDAAFLKPFSAQRGCLCTDCKIAIAFFPSTMQFSYAALGSDPEGTGKLVAYKVFSIDDYMAAVYNPLPAPFVLARKERKKQHMIWKARVNHHDVREEDLLFFTSGDTSLCAHPQRVLEVACKEQELLTQAAEIHSVGAKKKVRLLKEIVRLSAMKTNLCAPTLVFNDYRSLAYGIQDEALLSRLDEFCEVVRSFSSGDKHLFAHLRFLGALKKTTDFKALIASLKPREVDMQAIIYGKPPVEPGVGD